MISQLGVTNVAVGYTCTGNTTELRQVQDWNFLKEPFPPAHAGVSYTVYTVYRLYQ